MRILLVIAMLLFSASVAAVVPEIALSVGGRQLTVEVAHTESARRQGLMHRRMLPASRGMLFIFSKPARHGMWMLNTYIPLSIAFLDEKGVIINIADMAPHSRAMHFADRPAKYALEVNRGWFAEKGIEPGTRIEGIERARPAP